MAEITLESIIKFLGQAYTQFRNYIFSRKQAYQDSGEIKISSNSIVMNDEVFSLDNIVRAHVGRLPKPPFPWAVVLILFVLGSGLRSLAGRGLLNSELHLARRTLSFFNPLNLFGILLTIFAWVIITDFIISRFSKAFGLYWEASSGYKLVISIKGKSKAESIDFANKILTLYQNALENKERKVPGMTYNINLDSHNTYDSHNKYDSHEVTVGPGSRVYVDNSTMERSVRGNVSGGTTTFGDHSPIGWEPPSK